MKLSRGHVPPRGWHFPVAQGVLLQAPTEKMLTDAIYEYRIRHNIVPGNIERDIDDYYCTKWPEACQKEPSDYGHPAARLTPREPLVNRIARWAAELITHMPQGGYNLVAVSEAQRRALICIGCPNNTGWRVGCPGCNSSVLSLLGQIKQLRRLGHDPMLQGCSEGGWENGAAVHLPHECLPLSDSQQAALPDRCWRKTR